MLVEKKSAYFRGTSYLGSGKLLKEAVKEFGWYNFRVDLLEECSSLQELNEAEVKWINYYDAVASDKFYNLALKTFPSNEGVPPELQSRYGKSHSEETKRRIGESNSHSRYINNGFVTRKISADSPLPEGWFEGTLYKGDTHYMSGRRLSKETCHKLSLNALHTIWINNGKVNRKIPEGAEVPEGWTRGLLSNNSTKGSVWINNGFSHKRIPASSELPEGWSYGQIKNLHKALIWITDGVDSKMISPLSKIPQGWRKGRTYPKHKE